MRFSIRDLLLVTVIVALAVGWGVDHRRQAAEIEEQWELRIGLTVSNSYAPAPNPAKP